jgi:hypothetical protein
MSCWSLFKGLEEGWMRMLSGGFQIRMVFFFFRVRCSYNVLYEGLLLDGESNRL